MKVRKIDKESAQIIAKGIREYIKTAAEKGRTITAAQAMKELGGTPAGKRLFCTAPAPDWWV